MIGKCERCGVDVLRDAPDRCLDWRCPTMPDDMRKAQPKPIPPIIREPTIDELRARYGVRTDKREAAE